MHPIDDIINLSTSEEVIKWQKMIGFYPEPPPATLEEWKTAILDRIHDGLTNRERRITCVVDHYISSIEKMKMVLELTKPREVSQTKALFALDEAATYILSYTNRKILPFELYQIQIRIAVDIILYRTPDLFYEPSTGAGLGLGVKNLELDDIKLEGQSADVEYQLSRSTHNPNMDFLKDYRNVLDMWRVVPRYRRPPRERQWHRHIDAVGGWEPWIR